MAISCRFISRILLHLFLNNKFGSRPVQFFVHIRDIYHLNYYREERKILVLYIYTFEKYNKLYPKICCVYGYVNIKSELMYVFLFSSNVFVDF